MKGIEQDGQIGLVNHAILKQEAEKLGKNIGDPKLSCTCSDCDKQAGINFELVYKKEGAQTLRKVFKDLDGLKKKDVLPK